MKRLMTAVFLTVASIVVVLSVNLSTQTDPALVGQWSTSIPWPHVGAHIHLLRTGEVLSWQYGSTSSVWNPTTGVFSPTPNNFTDLFCAGHAFLPDGRLITVGGWERAGGGLGVKEVDFFNPDTRAWARAPAMTYRRWHPSSTTIPDGRVLITSGDTSQLDDIAEVPEIYDPASNTIAAFPSAANPLPVEGAGRRCAEAERNQECHGQ